MELIFLTAAGMVLGFVFVITTVDKTPIILAVTE